MKIAVGSEHAGNDYRIRLLDWLEQHGYETVDVHETDSVSGYPAVAEKVCLKVNSSDCGLGILICGTGIGMCMAAGKIPGIRAALCTDSYMGRMAKEHNNANILAFGSRVIGFENLIDILQAFLHAEFQEGRHLQRLGNLTLLEEKYLSTMNNAVQKQ